jgi:outer membrane protein OmpA-like peptidoglycan-associated protein
MKLSKKRVEVIKKYLTFQGIDQKRIVTQAFGARKPLTRSRDESSKQLNRRVEFKITKY